MEGFPIEARQIRCGHYDRLSQGRISPDLSPDHCTRVQPSRDSDVSITSHNFVAGDNRESFGMLDTTHKFQPKAFYPNPASKRVTKHILTAVAAIIGVGIPFALCFGVAFSNRSPTGYHIGVTYCTTLSLDMYEEYHPSLWLDITVAFGTLSFGQAKLADLTWDITVTRGGQAMLGWITYKVYTAILLRIMEENRVSYKLYSTISLQWASILSLGPLFKTFFSSLGWRKNILVLWIISSVIWVTLWPVWTNAMTGYVPLQDTLVKLKERSGFVNYTTIAAPENMAFQFSNISRLEGNDSWVSQDGPILMQSGPDVQLWSELYDLAMQTNDLQHGIDQYNESSNPQTGNNRWSVSGYVFFRYENQSYNAQYFTVSNNVQCIARGVYQWGFAIYVCAFFALFNAFWAIGTYAVWTHMNRRSQLLRYGRSLGKYRAAIDMSEAIKVELGSDICAYTDAEIEEELSRQGGVKYHVTYCGGDEGEKKGHIGLETNGESENVRLRYGQMYGGRIVQDRERSS